MLHPGLYDQPIDRALAKLLRTLSESDIRDELLDPVEAPAALGRVLHQHIVRALEAAHGNPKERLQLQLRIANDLLQFLRNRSPKGVVLEEDDFEPPARRLVSVLSSSEGRLARPEPPCAPSLPLGTSDLLVNGRHDLSLGPEVKKEISSADGVDLLCSFLKWSGFRLVEPALRALLAEKPGCVRVLTTAYMGATERRALDELANMGAQVRVSYDTTRTRLHAKAWLFHRNTGFSTGYIGSSNLSAAAMLDGLEWNVRLSKVDNGPILDKFSTVFDQYWEDPEFRPYDPEADARTYDDAIRRQVTDRTRLITAFDIRPRPHQQEILDALEVERGHGHNKNLVVAATGTGKTVVAALDYRRLRKALGKASLLFVAHRREILEQSLTTFRVVLRDGAFGERLYAGEMPRSGEHVFASVQSVDANRLANLSPDAFDVVIVDEFHHAEAPTYERLLSHLKPKYLIGLTATPERTDGRSVLGWFDGRIAAELRLWKALDQGLLSPFQYFGVEGPDVSAVKWSRGRYDVGELRNVYTADDFFVKRVLQEVHAKVTDPTEMRALGFCVDVAHAEFMTARFNEAGLDATCVFGRTPKEERRSALERLKNGDLRALFSVDLFNEGVDLPDVDTLIFLRPTESATLFLQQLGRGLRLSEDKDCLTVLDFIGGANRKFRFDARFRAIIGGTRRSVQRQIEHGFPSLPSGCAIQLDRVAEKAVLDNIRHSLHLGARGLIEDLRSLGDVPLGEFLTKADVELEDVYAGPGRCFTSLRRAAGIETGPDGPDDKQLASAFARLLHLDDPVRIDAFRRLIGQATPPKGDPDDPFQRMLFMLLGYVRQPLANLDAAWRSLWASTPLRRELRQLLDLLEDNRRNVVHPLTGRLSTLPLHIHGTYSLDEIMAAADQRTKKGGVKRIQTGVFYVAELRTDLLFVTLEKSDRDYSPTTLYRDYPISDTRFHWESQSSCHEETKTGRRYQRIERGAGERALLFVRERRKDDRGQTLPYVLLGPIYYVSHTGGRPMQIIWELEHRIPAAYYQEVKIAAG